MRIGRYLLGRPRTIWKFDLQESTSQFDTYTDANWAGCRRTRKSTSGGVIMIGTHLIKSGAKTQATIAKSSTKSELYGIMRGTCEALGFISLAEDLGAEVLARLHMNATAAQGIIDRRGLSKVCHQDVNILCLQEQLARDKLHLIKVPGPENNAYLMTKHILAEMRRRHTIRMSLEFREG